MRNGILLILLLSSSFPALPWGRAGHRVVARLAERQLTDAARAKAAAVFGVEPEQLADAMADGSTWPDEIDRRATGTSDWHYIDLELNDCRSDMARRCPNGDCVTVKINELLANLEAGKVTKWSLAEQLKFVIHFVGDMHQPLHSSDNTDRGGNCVRTEAPVPSRNLHSLWDSGILEQKPVDEKAMAQSLEAAILPVWKTGTVEDWMWESHIIGIGTVYGPLLTKIAISNAGLAESCDAGVTVQITQAYIDNAEPVVKMQLAKAGARLAKLLNDTWK